MKKAQYLKFTHVVMWAVLLVFVLLVVSIFTSGFVKKSIDVRDAEARILANRILYSPSSISRYDADMGKSYPGTVDINRMKNDILDKSVYIKNNLVAAAKVTVKDMSGTVMAEAVFNSLWYSRWQPMVGKRGSAGVGETVEKRYVAVYEGDEFRSQGIVEIRVLIPNA